VGKEEGKEEGNGSSNKGVSEGPSLRARCLVLSGELRCAWELLVPVSAASLSMRGSLKG